MVLNNLLAINNVIRPLCIVLPQMSEYIKYFDDVRKNMFFKIEDDNVLVKYNKIWDKIKMTLSIKFHCQSVYDVEYIKAKVKTFNKVVNTIFSDSEIPKS